MSQHSFKKIDQKEYLKKYLSGDKKKKKKKDKKSKKSTVKIVDDDITHVDCEIDDELLLGGDDAPQIVAVYTEEQPQSEKLRNKWKSIAVKEEPDDDKDNGDIWIRKANELNIKKERSSTTPDTTPPRRKSKHKYGDEHKSRSPVGRAASCKSSPVHRSGLHFVNNSPSRKNTSSYTSSSHQRSRKSSQSPERNNSASDQSPPRKYRASRDSDQSPPRKIVSLKSQCRRSPSSDQSPIRRHKNLRTRQKMTDSKSHRYRSPPRDQSPPRRKYRNDSSDQSPPRRHKNGNHQSPSKRSLHKIKRESDHSNATKIEDTSPPTVSMERKKRNEESLSPPPTHNPKVKRTLEGKKAGLQNAAALQEETAERRLKEQHLFEQMPKEISGRGAEVQVRSTARMGRKARLAREETSAERKLREAKEQETKLKYERWGKGLKQIEDYRQRKVEEEYESSKPLARYANDEDLDKYLREKEYAEDPMLEYMRQKRKENEKLSDKPKKQIYEGPYPENRFGIRPGYRWDGVDRSNGYEKKWLTVQSERQATQNEAYKYSIEDM